MEKLDQKDQQKTTNFVGQKLVTSVNHNKKNISVSKVQDVAKQKRAKFKNFLFVVV